MHLQFQLSQDKKTYAHPQIYSYQSQPKPQQYSHSPIEHPSTKPQAPKYYNHQINNQQHKIQYQIYYKNQFQLYYLISCYLFLRELLLFIRLCCNLRILFLLFYLRRLWSMMGLLCTLSRMRLFLLCRCSLGLGFLRLLFSCFFCLDFFQILLFLGKSSLRLKCGRQFTQITDIKKIFLNNSQISQLTAKKINQQFNNNSKLTYTQRMIQHIKKFFLVIIGLTCFTCFQRADYNLPLFAFAYFLWDYTQPNSQKTRLFYLFLSTWLVDFIWLIYWGVTWSSEEYQNSGEAGSSTFVMALSIISFIVKLGVIILLFMMDMECKSCITHFVPNVKSIYSSTPNSQQNAPY